MGGHLSTWLKFGYNILKLWERKYIFIRFFLLYHFLMNLNVAEALDREKD